MYYTTLKTADPFPAPEWHEALFYHSLPGGLVQCDLCPRHCQIKDNQSGFCQVRCNRQGKLFAPTFGHLAAMHVDPIEKKPLAHYLPGTKTFSIGTFGCNLGCKFCQNDSLSRHGSDRRFETAFTPPEKIIEMALNQHCQSIALTYNEPTVFIEYGLEVARLAREAKLGTVLVSNGFIEPEPRKELYRLIDAANIDVKSYAPEFYQKLCGAALPPVLESCRYYRKTVGGHLEITNLLIPNCNDRDEQIAALVEFVANELGLDTPVHFSAYFPAGGFTEPPTPPATLYRARELALKRGLRFVHLGNLH